jgi:hypothetical protein
MDLKTRRIQRRQATGAAEADVWTLHPLRPLSVGSESHPAARPPFAQANSYRRSRADNALRPANGGKARAPYNIVILMGCRSPTLELAREGNAEYDDLTPDPSIRGMLFEVLQVPLVVFESVHHVISAIGSCAQRGLVR